MTPLVVGLDAGGTGTRCVVATLDGRVVGRGRAAGANVHSSADPSANLATALRAATADVDLSGVAAGVLGLAGAGPAGHTAATHAARAAWTAAGLPGHPAVVPDVETAFASATSEPSGSLLIAGTGAIAARFVDGRMVRRADGHGWLVGDEGGGAWLGLQALKAVLAALDGRGPATALVEAVLAEVIGGGNGDGVGVGGGGGAVGDCADDRRDRADVADLTADGDDDGGSGRDVVVDSAAAAVLDRSAGRHPITDSTLSSGATAADGQICAQALVARLYPPQPPRIAALAPLVDAAARAGDPEALAIVGESARLLLRSLAAVLAEGAAFRHEPVIVAGSLLVQPTTVAERVRAALARDHPGRPVLDAGDAAAGAAALAIRTLIGATAADAAHRRLLAGGAATRA